MDAIVTSMTSAISTFATDALGAVGSIIPVVLPIMGALVVVSIGIKVFKRFTH